MPTIFVSYSHQDVGLVGPVVRLLRATEDTVFQDVDSIAPGRQWRREIEEALSAAETFVLFWCHHSSKSAEVRAEYQWVLAVGKNVMPVLLDGTPLPAPLNEFQWVDFRHFAGATHRSSRRWLTRLAVVVLMVGLVSFATYRLLAPMGVVVESSHSDGPLAEAPIPEPELKYKYKHTYPPYAVPADPESSLASPPVAVEPLPPPPEPRKPAPQKVGGFLWLCGLVLIATLGALVIRRVRKRRRLQTVMAPNAPPPPGGTYVNGGRAGEMGDRGVPQDAQHAMAEQLRAELVRRGMGSA